MSRRGKALRKTERAIDLYNIEDPNFLPSHSTNSQLGGLLKQPQTSRDTRNKQTRRTSKSTTALTSLEYIRITSRFVVHPALPDAYMTSPDAALPSSSVLRVLVPVSECPICLEPARVPRMLDCGHILCLVCLHQYKNEVEIVTCPLCMVPVSRKTTPVTFYQGDDRFLPQVGHEVVLRLVKRNMIQPPHYATDADQVFSKSPRIPSVDHHSDLAYSRLLKATHNYLVSECRREEETLLKERSEVLALYGTDSGYKDALEEIAELAKLELQNNQAKFPVPPAPALPPNVDPREPFYFYQTCFESLTTFILSSLDISVLKSTFGGYASFPKSLMVKITNISYSTLSQDDRKRLKFLSHLPLHSPIAFMECDWQDIISPDAQLLYGVKLERRLKTKMKKDDNDEKRRVLAQDKTYAEMKAQVLESLPEMTTLNLSEAELPTLSGSKPPVNASKSTKWDYNRADRVAVEALVEKAFVPKRGRKRLVILD